MRSASPRFLPPLAPLAGYVSLLLAPALTAHAGNPPPSASAANTTGMTIAVTNCNDDGTGSLRATVASALSGDTIDMRGLACRRINLTSGAIAIPQNDLTLVGGGRITVDANRLSSVFRHSGTGWLRIRGMTIARGFYRSDTEAHGGCLYSAGKIELRYALVHWCHVRAIGNDTFALGGGLYAARAVTLISSRVLGNSTGHADPAKYRLRHGGGIYALGRLTSHHSSISGNHAYQAGGAWANRGIEIHSTTFSKNTGDALFAINGNGVIANSTISGNTGNPGSVATAFVRDHPRPGGYVLIVNSTISGNTSGHALEISSWNPSIVNSTIVFNRRSGTCEDEGDDGVPRDVGMVLVGPRGTPSTPGTSLIESTIIASSSCNGDPHFDFDLYGSGGDVEGGNNLIMSWARGVRPPSDTISADPRLVPLADNGGRTRTHALLDDSPAIDSGNNAAGLTYDQRGPGHPRVKGLQADIGAYER